MLPVGSIVTSLLLEKDFKAEMKKIEPKQVWELAAHRPIPEGRLQEIVRNDKAYAVLYPNKVATLPDLRGLFLRGLNENRSDGKGDTSDPDRLMASYQEDAFKSHDHYISKTYPNQPHNADLDAGRQTHANKGWPPPDGDQYPTARTAFEGHKEETRPRNVAVNYFVRVV